MYIGINRLYIIVLKNCLITIKNVGTYYTPTIFTNYNMLIDSYELLITLKL